MKNIFFPLILTALIITACAEKHYSSLKGDQLTFYYKDSAAREVLFASSGDAYRLHPAREKAHHLWEVSIPAANEFAYFYVVDGVVTLPEAIQYVRKAVTSDSTRDPDGTRQFPTAGPIELLEYVGLPLTVTAGPPVGG